jgi:hypothetical protein
MPDYERKLLQQTDEGSTCRAHADAATTPRASSHLPSAATPRKKQKPLPKSIPACSRPGSSKVTEPSFAEGDSGRSLDELLLEHAISTHLPPGKSLSLRLTDNRYTIISVRRGGECYRVRLHRMFVESEPRLVRALARYIVHNDQRSSELLGEFIEENSQAIRPAQKKDGQELRTRGRFHDLRAVYDRLNRRYFDGKHDARITWGPARGPRRQRSINVGSYSVEDRLIRVHPVLDHAIVPSFFLDFVVFHEMLHGKHTIQTIGGRRSFHPPEFARDEQRFRDYGRARLWERRNMDRLLSGSISD